MGRFFGGQEVKFSAAVCVFVLCFLLHFILITEHVGYDESNFLASGWLLNQHGYKLYAHNENKMPLAYFIPQVFASLFNGVGIILYSRLFSILFYSLLAFLVCVIAREWFGDIPGFYAGLVFSLLSASDYTAQYTYVTWVMFSQLALFYFLTKKNFMGAGLSFALGLWFIQNMVFLLPLVLYRLLWSDGKNRDLLLFVCGFVAFSFPILLWSIFYVDFGRVWFALVEYNLLPTLFPLSGMDKIIFIFNTFLNNPIFLITTCFIIFFIFQKKQSEDWIKSGLVSWVLCLLLMLFALSHLWGQYLMFFYIPCSIIFGYVVGALKDSRFHVVLIVIVLYTMIQTITSDINNSFLGRNLFIDTANTFELRGCKSIYIIGNEEAYAVSGIAPPKSEVERRSFLLPDTWSLFSRNREFMLDYSELDRMFNATDCVAFLPPGDNEPEIVSNINLVPMLERNGFIKHDMSYGGFLWRK